MLEPAVPGLFALPGNAAAALQGNHQVVSLSSPATMGESIAHKLPGFGKSLYAMGCSRRMQHLRYGSMVSSRL
jgi:hypothetical protein